MATERFVDANVLLRHFAQDNPEHSPAASALLVRVRNGEEAAWTTHLVMAEVVWVLSGKTYQASRQEIAEALTDFVAHSNVRVTDGGVIVEALRVFSETSLSFIDAYHVALIRRHEPPEMYSFDQGFDRLTGFTRFEPSAADGDNARA